MVTELNLNDGGDDSNRKIITKPREKDANVLLRKNLTSLAIFGLWPFQSNDFLNNRPLRRFHYAFGLTVYFLFIVFLVTEYIELAHVWGDLEDMTTNMSVSCLYTLGVMKIYAFFGHRNELKSLLAGISRIEVNILTFQSEEIKQILFRYVARAWRITYFFWTLTGCTIMVFFIIPPIEYRFSSTYHKVFDNGSEYWSYKRPMIFSSWFPFDKYANGNYLAAYVYHVLMGSIGAAYQAIWDTFIVSMMIHSIGQLQILQKTIVDMTSCDVPREANFSKCLYTKKNLYDKTFQEYSLYRESLDEIKHNRLVHCVNHHRYILSYTKDLNAILSPVMMLYFMVCSLMLCAIGFQASLYGFSIRLCFMVEYLIAMMIQLFLFYWNGNEVIYESDKLLLATYSCDWYNESSRFKKSLWIMREGVKIPVQYTVGRFYSMSLPTFLAILRASYSYFALLRQVQEDQPDT